MMKVLVCKITKKEFKDINNKNGKITTHLKDLRIDIPSEHYRRKFFKSNDSHWYLQYFDIIEKIDKEKFKCKYCNWETTDLLNNSGCYTKHLKDNHNKEIDYYLIEFPEEKNKFKTFLYKKNNNIELEKKENHVECKICGFKGRYLTNTHLKKHNITPEDYKIKFGIQDYSSVNFINKSRSNFEIVSKTIKKSFVSIPEKDLKQFIKNLGFDILSNNKSMFDGVEIDIIIPDKKICFEFNGNLYHLENYGKKKKFFHLNKTEICKDKGYKLIHIMEDEWYLKNDIIKEKIKNILGVNDKISVYARKCLIKNIDSKEKNEFLNKNHIQGEDKSDIFLGAFYNDQLVSVCTFDSKRNMMKNLKDNSSEVELKRFASDNNLKVVGIFSRFISFFKKNYKFDKIISFLDIRWNPDGVNNTYTKNGFILEKILKPDYTYYNSKVSRYSRFHKFSFGKNSLKIKFKEIYCEEKTEWEIMQLAGYDRIWDCGKFKFVHYI